MMEALRMPWISLRERLEASLLPRYQQLESREQRVLLFAAIVLPLILVVFGLLLPLQDHQQALQKQLTAAQIQAAEAEQLALFLSQHASELQSSGGVQQNLLTTVEGLARQTSVRSFMVRIKPHTLPDGSEQLMLRMKDAPYDATLRFIHALASHKLGLSSLKLQPAKVSGHIHVRAVITGSR